MVLANSLAAQCVSRAKGRAQVTCPALTTCCGLGYAARNIACRSLRIYHQDHCMCWGHDGSFCVALRPAHSLLLKQAGSKAPWQKVSGSSAPLYDSITSNFLPYANMPIGSKINIYIYIYLYTSKREYAFSSCVQALWARAHVHHIST